MSTDHPPTPVGPMSDAEPRRRQEAVDFANANVELEGFEPVPELAGDFARFVAGEIELADMLNALNEKYSK